MDFRILGPLEVLDEKHVLDVGGGKQRGVLALLLIHANEVVSSDRLIEGLWPEQHPPSAAKIVQSHISRLRKALAVSGNGVLATRGNGYVLHVEPGQLDVDRFRALLDAGREALAADDPDKAAEKLEQALALWRGPPLVDFAYDSFAQEEIVRLEDLHLAALEERIEADLALGRHDDVLQELNELVRRHPLRERLRGQLMLALYRAGRQADALEVYREGRRRLANDLGLEPSPFLQQLERAVLTHDPALEAPTRSQSDRARRKGGLLLVAGSVVLLAAVISVSMIELTADGGTRGLTAVAPDSVGVIDPSTNDIVDQIPVGAAPTEIATGPSGVWVISQQDGTLTRIDPQTRLTTRTIAPKEGPPVDVVVGEKAVWLLISSRKGLGGGAARIGRVDPGLKQLVDTFPIGTGSFGFGSGPVQSLAASGGALWVMSPSARVAVTRIDETTQKVSPTFTAGEPNYGFNSGTAGGVPGSSGIAVGGGSVWVGSDAGVIRIAQDLSGGTQTVRLGVPIPTAISVGEGAVWVVGRPGYHCCPAETVGTGTLTRIDPATNDAPATIDIGGNPAGLAVGEGSVWIADPTTRSVIRVNPETKQVARIKVGGRPRGIAVGAGAVWVSVG
jgi:DNA-binding SARP family transcriptional activator/streptogramin lyase